MSVVWTPKNKPPRRLSDFGEDATKIWETLCQKDQLRKKNSKHNLETGLSYYESLYKKAFKAKPPADHALSCVPQNTSQPNYSQASQTVLHHVIDEPAVSDSSKLLYTINERSSYKSSSGERHYLLENHSNNKIPCHELHVVDSNRDNVPTVVPRDIINKPLNEKESLKYGHISTTSVMLSPQSSSRHSSKELDACNMPSTVLLQDCAINSSYDIPVSAVESMKQSRGEYLPTRNVQSGKAVRQTEPLLHEQLSDFEKYTELCCLAATPQSYIKMFNDQLGVEYESKHIVDSGPESPPLDFENDIILSQIPKLCMVDVKNDSYMADSKHTEVNSIEHKNCSEASNAENQDEIYSGKKEECFGTTADSYGSNLKITGRNHEHHSRKTTNVFGINSTKYENHMTIPRSWHNFENPELAICSIIGSDQCCLSDQPHSIQNIVNSQWDNNKMTIDNMEEVQELNILSSSGTVSVVKTVGNSNTNEIHKTGTSEDINPQSRMITTTGIPIKSNISKPSTLASRLKKLKDSCSNISKSKNETKSQQTGKRQHKLHTFTVPLKRQPKQKSNDNCQSAGITAVEELSDVERQRLADRLQSAEEIAMTLIYSDGSSQLREIIDKKKRSVPMEYEVLSLAVAYPVTKNSTRLECVTFSLPGNNTLLHVADITEWKRSTINDFMKGETKKLVFDGQELIESLMVSFTFDSTQVLSWNILDTKIAGWLLDPDDPPVTFTHLVNTIPGLEEVNSLPNEDVRTDLDQLRSVMSQIYHQLQCNDLWTLYSKVEMPLVPILACMQQRGIHVDISSLMEAGEWIKKKLKLLEKEAFQAAGHSFLLNSHPQLRQILFEELRLDKKLPPSNKIARTARNLYRSTSEAVLKQLSNVHHLPGLILQYRQIQKIKSTYIDGILPCIKDGLLYTHWDHTAAVTGRITSVHPNIQATPRQPVVIDGVRENFVRDKDDIPVTIHPRQPFIAKLGCSFITADFQQIELRLLADLSKDANLMAAFTRTDDNDIFIQLASQWLGKSPEEISTRDREQAKRIVYSVMYGAGKEKLAEYLSISADNAKAIMTSFLGKFPEICNFTKKCISEARYKGYLCTILGRRRWFPQINHHNATLRAQAERQAVNFSIQGSAADLCKMAMIKVEHCLANKPHLHARVMIQIHDELLLEVPDDEIAEVTGSRMRRSTDVALPLWRFRRLYERIRLDGMQSMSATKRNERLFAFNPVSKRRPSTLTDRPLRGLSGTLTDTQKHGSSHLDINSRRLAPPV